MYTGKADVLPEHIEVWKIPLIDFQVKKPVLLSLPMAIDFGSVNTTAGVYPWNGWGVPRKSLV